MSQSGESPGGRGDKPSSSPSSPSGGGSPRTPRGGRLKDRVSFFEKIWSSGGKNSRAGSSEDLVDSGGVMDAGRRPLSSPSSPIHRRSSSRASDSSFEESFERLVEEGELNGAKVVKFEKMTFRKSLREVTTSTSSSLMLRHGNNFTTESSATPSEEHALEDSAYQSHGVHGSSHGSSMASFPRFPSEENISQQSGRRGSESQEEKPPSEWYAEYRNQSFHNVAARIEYVRSRSEYDAHIAEIKGTRHILLSNIFHPSHVRPGSTIKHKPSKHKTSRVIDR